MPRGLARDHQAKRAALRKGAAEYFAENGYDRASMAGAAAACDVSKALIYHYYSGKDDLLFDILDAHLAHLVAVAEAVPKGPDYLRRLIRAILCAYRDADAEHKLQASALARLPPNRRAPLVTAQRRLVILMEKALSGVAPALPPDRRRPVTMTVFGMLNWFYMWHRPGRGLTREAYADLVTDMILGGARAL